ncbi:MAG: deacetylase SIR2 [Lentilactobacillus buchneri]|jgi:NAD-dependent SIR2 family protein deacetylase|nr:deacetylase SIR2 [Lentilactobacillus buchneri]MCI2028641.1 deacetylase SIR2 [Lentilactobacillus buchneri]
MVQATQIWKSLGQTGSQTDQLRALIDEAEATVVGIGAGMPAADGFSYVGPRFETHFADFIQKYHFYDMLQAFLADFEDWSEYWAFESRFVLLNGIEQPEGKLYHHFRAFMDHGDRHYTIINTNGDNTLEKAHFDRNRIFNYQGQYSRMQCSKFCTPVTYRDDDLIRKMVREQKELRVPENLIPKCPNCGAPLEVNKRTDAGMVEDAEWHREAKNYHDFLDRWHGLKVLYLEIGVGNTTPWIIRKPFWKMTRENPNALYVMLNQKDYQIPEELQGQSLRLNQDMTQVIGHL